MDSEWPEALLQRCAENIEREAHPKDRADLLAVSQVLTGLRFPDTELLRLLGGKEPMIESPLLQKLMAERSHKHILKALRTRFGSVPRDVTTRLRDILDEEKLMNLTGIATSCPNVEAFRQALLD